MPRNAQTRRPEAATPAILPANPVANLPDAAIDSQPCAAAAEAGDARRLAQAVLGLWARRPELSARQGAALWQACAGGIIAGGSIGFSVALADAALLAASVLLSVPFLCVVALRTLAGVHLACPPLAATRPASPLPATLPRYSVLVPLYDEADVLPQLLAALGRLDYPADRLQILLVLEAGDAATRAALARLRLPAHFQTLVVPDCQPRTKPKALNYALNAASGAFVAIYDAEDQPEPDQLRRALARFAADAPDLACVQARLAIDNAQAGFLAAQFAIEYAALFDALLPAIERLGLPMPLGGTSNHFRADILRAVGAWDPFNVTEDADLGLRLARLGYRTATIASTTWEEAPVTAGNWLRQRTRWLKGWMQTYLVHTRHPGRLHRELGAWRHGGLHVLMGGMLLSVLAYPWCLTILGLAAWNGRLLADPQGELEHWLWWVSAVNLGLGFGSAVLVGALAAIRRGQPALAAWALAMPLYWLLIAAAGYRALYQLVVAPHLWEKTAHGASPSPNRRR